MKNWKDPKWWLGVAAIIASVLMGSGAFDSEGVWMKLLAALAALGGATGTVMLRPAGEGLEKFPPGPG